MFTFPCLQQHLIMKLFLHQSHLTAYSSYKLEKCTYGQPPHSDNISELNLLSSMGRSLSTNPTMLLIGRKDRNTVSCREINTLKVEGVKLISFSILKERITFCLQNTKEHDILKCSHHAAPNQSPIYLAFKYSYNMKPIC